MKYESMFYDFCDAYGYTGTYIYNKITSEYQIVLSRGKDNAGVFLNPGEYKDLKEDKLKDLLEMLDQGFSHKFK